MKIRQEILSSRNNPLVKWAASLADKKERSKARSFFVEGEKLSLEAIKNRLPISYIFIAESKYDRAFPKIEKAVSSWFSDSTLELITLSDGAFEKISTEKAP